MSTYNGYGSVGLPIMPVFLGLVFMACAVLLVLSMMGGAAVQVAPKPTPNRVGGVDIDKAVAEAKELIPNLKPGDSLAGYLTHSTNGLLRVVVDLNGQLLVVGASTPALKEAAEAIATQIGAIVW